MDNNTVRLIKISKAALFEFIYEKIVEKQDIFLDVDPTEVSDYFDMNYENGEFIFAAIKSEDGNGDMLTMPEGIDLQKLMKKIPDTTGSMFAPGKKYKEYTKQELIDLSR